MSSHDQWDSSSGRQNNTQNDFQKVSTVQTFVPFVHMCCDSTRNKINAEQIKNVSNLNWNCHSFVQNKNEFGNITLLLAIRQFKKYLIRHFLIETRSCERYDDVKHAGNQNIPFRQLIIFHLALSFRLSISLAVTTLDTTLVNIKKWIRLSLRHVSIRLMSISWICSSLCV